MKLYSKLYGNLGTDLIIVHGLFGMSDNWNSLGKKFAQHFKVHLIDLRNHGKSPHSDDFNYNVMSDDLFEYIKDNKIIKPIVLGHSLGGKVAMNLAFTYPTLLYKMVVVDIAPREYSTHFHQNLIRKMSNLELKSFSNRKEIDGALAKEIENVAVRSFLMKNLYLSDSGKFSWRFNINVLLEKLVNIQHASFVNGVCDVATCFIKGEKSDYINTSDEAMIAECFSDVHFIKISGAGHWVHAENPQDFYSQTLAFLVDS